MCVCRWVFVWMCILMWWVWFEGMQGSGHDLKCGLVWVWLVGVSWYIGMEGQVGMRGRIPTSIISSFFHN